MKREIGREIENANKKTEGQSKESREIERERKSTMYIEREGEGPDK